MTPEALAAARERHMKNIRDCAGPCKRSTRSSKVPAHLFPETVSRFNALYCTSCWRGIQEEQLKAEGKPVPARGPTGYKEIDPERLEKLRSEADEFTARRRARLAQKGWFLHGPTALPRTELDRRRAAHLRPARGPAAADGQQERTG